MAVKATMASLNHSLDNESFLLFFLVSSIIFPFFFFFALNSLNHLTLILIVRTEGGKNCFGFPK